jgi:pimeloyl-ACP methyl ester carboxylesterase
MPYASLNGLEMYYEVHGEGKPLVLIPGGNDTIETCYAQLLPLLALGRQVIAIEQQGHGRTTDVDRPLTFEQMGDDVEALIEYLGLATADVMGFSMGGGAAMQAAFRHPQRVRRLIVGSAGMRDDGWFPEVFEGLRAATPRDLVGSPWHESYLKLAPRPEDWNQSFGKVQQVVANNSYDWTEQFGALTMPVLIVAGDADSVKIAHVVEMFERLGGGNHDGFAGGMPRSRLVVLPGTNHLQVTSRTDFLVPAISAFLDAEG